MKQYLELLQEIKEKGTYKPAARENMPGTQSLFGHQFRHNLQEGFPLLTTKKIYWKGVVVELLWFLRGDTNIKYLVDNKVNIWNEDAYNFYCKKAKSNDGEELDNILQPVSNKLNTRNPNPEEIDVYSMFTFEEFIEKIKSSSKESLPTYKDYTLGDCGYQYGKVWRDWQTDMTVEKNVDQIKNVLDSLRKNPESRRHIVTAVDPAHDNNLALYWCHAMFQFNCRPLTIDEREEASSKMGFGYPSTDKRDEHFEYYKIPKYYLDCNIYVRSNDVILGAPFNIASYALLIHVFSKICNMTPGTLIYTIGDAHIYDNHKEATEEQLSRTPTKLPTLNISDNIDWNYVKNTYDFNLLNHTDFVLENYNPQEKIKAELSTGFVK